MKSYDPPEYNEAVMCPWCQEKSEVITGLYGMFGGGIGPYTMCADCGTIVTKSYGDRSIKGEFTEVDNGQRSAIEENKD